LDRLGRGAREQQQGGGGGDAQARRRQVNATHHRHSPSSEWFVVRSCGDTCQTTETGGRFSDRPRNASGAALPRPVAGLKWLSGRRLRPAGRGHSAEKLARKSSNSFFWECSTPCSFLMSA